jgi:hypothetical protein
MNLLALFGQLPQVAVIAFIASTIIPAFSAWVVREHWDSSITGVVTLGLSTADGFFSEWAKDGDSFNWKYAIGIALGSWAIAAITQSKILSGTQLEAWLLASDSRLKFDDVDESDAIEGPTDPTEGYPWEDAPAANPTASPPST